MIKIQIRSIFGSMLFERESEKNTIKETAEKANLSRANLSEANLSGADLSEADLPIFCKWNVTIIDGKIKIGCKEMSVEDWVKWFASNEEFETKRGSEEFNRIHAMFIAYSSYLKFLNTK